ncbi:WYL domain-containing protein [Inconstantimicrobium mannanitabidum]|uniref:Uncharacterized protein n=1 Tax=Inconstantimicrobium mannanitabidum TaxID=1604901 RepID=A0ACB5RAA4_9CLOT|nr:WYL domain-containing protein [Clostridium sp. TW13]GKX65959.1 hypothetical protein rsdtw13_12170 [Clostridium sp. TW13]
MELFHEYKNKYFHFIFRILNLANTGISEEEIIKLVDKEEYEEKAIGKDFRTFEGMLTNEYNPESNLNLLKRIDNKFYAVINEEDKLPLKVRFSKVEKEWLNGLIKEPIVQVLLGREIVSKLEKALININEGNNNIIEFTNKIKRNFGYDYDNVANVFFTILQGIIKETPIRYTNVDKYGNEYIDKLALPIRIEYSIKDDVLRASLYSIEDNRSVLVNLHTLREVKIDEDTKLEINREQILKKLRESKYCDTPITLELQDTRGVVERCFMSFSSFERTSRELDKGKYEMDIYYYTFDESEVINKILSLGPYVKVKSPERVKNILIDRIKKAYE